VAKCVKNLPPNPVLDKIRTLVYEFKDTIPVVVALRNPALEQVHWDNIKNDIIGQEFDIDDEEFTL
jgi:dynein heavy chain